MTFAPEDEEDQATLLIREIRQKYLTWLEGACPNPRFFRNTKEDMTGQVLGKIVEDDDLADRWERGLGESMSDPKQWLAMQEVEQGRSNK